MQHKRNGNIILMPTVCHMSDLLIYGQFQLSGLLAAVYKMIFNPRRA